MVWLLHILLTAIPVAQADAGERNRQRSEGADKLPMPVAAIRAIFLRFCENRLCID